MVGNTKYLAEFHILDTAINVYIKNNARRSLTNTLLYIFPDRSSHELSLKTVSTHVIITRGLKNWMMADEEEGRTAFHCSSPSTFAVIRWQRVSGCYYLPLTEVERGTMYF